MKFQLRLCSWNIGSNSDFRRTHPGYADSSDQTVRLVRSEMFHTLFSSAMSPVGVYAFQEMHAEDWPAPTHRVFLPSHFDLFVDHEGRDRDTVVAWDTRQFSLVDNQVISARDKMWYSAMVHLICNETRTHFVVCSIHLIGFNQAADRERMAAQAEAGDVQLCETLCALDAYCQEKCVGWPVFVCGDLNADVAHYDKRHRILRDVHKFRLATPDHPPTFVDVNLNKPVTLDYIFSRGLTSPTVTPVFPTLSLTDGSLPADHLPVLADVVVQCNTVRSSCWLF